MGIGHGTNLNMRFLCWGTYGEAVGMSGFAERFEDVAAVNSEIRMITLELMKLAASQGKPFDQVAREFRENAFTLKRSLAQIPSARSRMRPSKNRRPK